MKHRPPKILFFRGVPPKRVSTNFLVHVHLTDVLDVHLTAGQSYNSMILYINVGCTQ